MKRFQKEWLVIVVVCLAIIVGIIQLTEPAFANGQCRTDCICSPYCIAADPTHPCTDPACHAVTNCQQYCYCIC